MNLQELDRLLEKYYNGDSKESEEKTLFELISTEDLPSEYNADRQILLGLLGSEGIPEPDNGFESRIMASIDESESRGRVISLKRRIYMAVSVAAASLIIVSSYFLLSRSSELEDTFDDPVLAYNAAIEVLEQFGRNMNSGMYALSELTIIGETEENLTKLSEPAKMVTKEMESLKYIKESIDLLDIGSAKRE